uniref:HhH-GPD domain-containing protein n=1 Tax=Leersia perrieri TaxID=77586 RepID=A0A0D9XH66_9ORYZ
MSSSMAVGVAGEAIRQKKLKRKKQAEAEMATAEQDLSLTPPNPAPVPSAGPQTPILGEAVAGRRKERKRKRDQVAAPSPQPATPSTIRREEEEAAGVGKKKKQQRERKKDPFLEAVTARRKEQPCDEQGAQCIHPLPLGGGQDNAPKGTRVKKRSSNSSNKKPRVLSDREIIKERIELLRKQQPLHQNLLDTLPIASNSDSISIQQQDSNYSSPFGAFFHQFCYKPNHSPPIPTTPDRLTRPPPRDHLSSASSQLMASDTCKINNSKKISKTKKPGSGPVSASLNQENTKLTKMEKPVREARVKKERKPPPLLSRAEQRSDKYRRLPLDQLVPPPRSPHKLLQEKYASDPWKVIVICMLLNLTQGIQVRRKVKGFFKRYPDAQTAFNADTEKMAKYLAPLGLQRVKAYRIQKFSKEYVEKEWTYITELCGVGKYAADAYAIFCAGKATEVVPKDHKLVDYWKYVCFELPMIQQSQDMQEAGVTEMEHAVPKVEELAFCC